VRAAGARWSAANREKIHAKEAKYRAANPEKVRARHAAYRDRSRDKKSEWEGRRRARKAAATITAITAELLEQRLSMFAGCWLCGGEPTEVDHVKPLIAGGAHCLANMRPICRSCNASKGGRWPYGRKP
jgi:5-methylcytosine-specific restriction endonuclease McrA